MSVEKENLRRTFLTFRQRNVISSPDILLNILSPDILSGENLPLRRTLEIFVGHVWQDRRISHTLQMGECYQIYFILVTQAPLIFEEEHAVFVCNETDYS